MVARRAPCPPVRGSRGPTTSLCRRAHLAPRRGRRPPSTARDRDDLARALKERIAADLEIRPRKTSPRPHVRRPEMRPVSARATPRRAEITHWKRPATSARRDRRDPPAPPHGHATADVHRESRHLDASKPAGAWLSPRAQPPPAPSRPPRDAARPRLQRGCRFGCPSRHAERGASRTRAKSRRDQPGRVEGEGRRVFARSAPRARTRAGRHARARAARHAPRRVRRPVGVHVRRIRDHGHSPRPRRCDIEGALESSGAVAVLRARRVPRPPPFGETRATRRRKRRSTPPPTRRRGRCSSRRPARSPRTDRARRLREPPPWQRLPDVRARGGPSRGHRKPHAVRRGPPRDTGSRGGGGGGGGGVGGRRVQSGPGDDARARAARREAPRVRGGHARTTDRGGEERRGGSRESAAEARLARGGRRRAAPRSGRRRVSGAVRGFRKQDGGVALGAGPALRFRRAAASAAPEPERHPPRPSRVSTREAARPRRTYRTPSPNGGAARTTATATRTASPFSRFPGARRAAAVWRRRIRKALGGAASVSARDAEKPAKDSSARGKTPGKSPRGRTPRGWAL